MNFGDIKNVHFVGIGGIGMSGIAEILAQAGVSVSGCDLKGSSSTDLLARRGVNVLIGHDAAHLDGVDLVVVTAAVRGKNREIDAAHERGIRVMRRSEILGEIVNVKRAVGVAGTHGKTTTSSMIAVVLEEAGLDPTVLVGGMVRNLDTNAKTGKGEFLVVEADEYDRTFHRLHPEVAVVTNIEADHLEYYGSFEAILEAFRVFLQGIKPGGSVVACVDDPAVLEIVGAPVSSPPPALNSAGEDTGAPKVVRYGLSDAATLRATNLEFDERGTTFDVKGVGSFRLFVPGEHNVRNALAAIGVARELGLEPSVIARGLARFIGVERRFQILGEYAGAIIVDDYAHHPTEIRATLSAARRGYPQRRIVALFQPHLYSRTRDFAGDFAAALGVADVALVAPIYAAREEPITGITSRMIAEAGEGIEFLEHTNEDIAKQLRGRLQSNDIFITMGAGDVHQIGEALVAGGGS
ncbi:MAG TPA: UDP-N-acetylmuramate--L-alanine ligase [Thermoanaerobaculia bacterium]|nr:UDP-N-acetylmuramate--L-alanine ligase [Thermoanaerobaculia bacterium]